MPTFFAYIRVSTVRQGERGVSLTEQKDAITNYAQRHGLTIAQWFEEKETAAKRGRPLFTQMLKLLQKQKVEGVIIHKIDRGARNLRDWAELGELIDRGIAVHFANENLDMYSRGGRLSADIQAVVAADYIRNLREEVKKGFYGRLKQGFYPLPAPLGYLDQGKAKVKELDPEKAPLVRKVFELYGSGRFSLKEVAVEAEKIGLKTRRGGRLSNTSIADMLVNPFYIGLIRIKCSNELFHGNHEPLISKALFDRVKAVLNGKATNRLYKHDYLFRRLLTCKSCDHSLIGEKQKGRVYYRCHSDVCPKTCLREDQIERRLKDKLITLQLTEQEEGFFKEAIAGEKAVWVNEKESLIESVRLRLGKSQERLKRLTDAFLDGVIDRDMFDSRKADLLLEQKDFEAQLLKLGDETSDIWAEVEKQLELAKTSYLLYGLGVTEQKREILESLTSNRIVNGKEVDFTWHLPFKILSERPKNPNGGPYRVAPRTFREIVNKIKESIIRSSV